MLKDLKLKRIKCRITMYLREHRTIFILARPQNRPIKELEMAQLVGQRTVVKKVGNP